MRSVRAIHAYSKDKTKLIEHNAEKKIEMLPKYNSLKDKLFARQKGKCPECLDPILAESEEVEIHHITPIGEGGSKSSITNMELLHKYCHRRKHGGRTQ